jgi:hypothetical protein
VAKVAKIPTSRRTWVSSPTNIAKNFSQQTLNGGGVFGDAADPTCPADDPGSTGPAVLGAVVVAPPWKPLDEPRRAAMDIIIGSEDRLPTMRPTMASGRSEKASSDGGHSIPWICAIPTPHGERIEGLGVAPPPPPREPRAGEEESPCALGHFFRNTECCKPCCSQHSTHKLATSMQTSLVGCCTDDGSQH